ncbi:MAG: radical SAM protein [Clostridia bacterium]|nr:radical SAM protein [Clostridia bacterium]
MTITYEVDGALYINVTNRCTNNCEFCIRKNGDGAYGSDSLWLEREPTEEEILDSVFGRDLSAYREIVFCGYGEPSIRLDVIRSVALRIKEKCPLPVRINTNGHSSLYHGYDTASAFCGAFDCVSISLNTPSPERYDEICHPVRSGSYEAMLDFAREVKKYVPSVLLSVVKDFLTPEELDECHRIADNLGVTLKVRDYIS